MTEIGFWRLAEAEPDRVCLVEDDGATVTRGELLTASNRVANGLRSMGLEPGAAVAILLANTREFLEVYLGAMQAGVYLTPINWHLLGSEIAYVLADCGAEAFFATERFAGPAAAAASEVGMRKDGAFSIGDVAGFTPYGGWLAAQSPDRPDAPTAGQIMLYTSGTTGRPKGVRRPLPGKSPDDAAFLFAAFAVGLGITPGDGVSLTTGPLYHTAPLLFSIGALHIGHKVVLMDSWTPQETLRRIETYRVTATHMVPTMFQRLLALPAEERERYDTSSLSAVLHAAAPCPVDVKRRMLDWWGPVITEYYAATEGGGTIARPEDWLAHPGTVGRPIPGAEIRIVDDDGAECPPGVPGTVYIKSPIGLFEYHGAAEKTSASRLGEFFTVGDIGYLDTGGWLFLCDRKHDVIISAGVNIYPAEIESLLQAHPGVRDVAVIGVPDDDRGESVKAIVEVAEGFEAGPDLAEEIVSFAREQMAAYKVPRSVDFCDALPREPSGKLYKRRLRDQYWAGTGRKI